LSWESGLAVLKINLTPAALDEVLAQAEREGWPALPFACRLLGEAAARRRERSLERRLYQADFRRGYTLETCNWEFNAATIHREHIEELATCAFVQRHDNLILVGQSGLGKSHLVEGLGRVACVQGFRVRYTTSAKLLQKLRAALADQTLAAELRYWTRIELLIIDEFGFDGLERQACVEAPQLLYQVIEGRNGQHSTVLVTNVDFEAWGEYLGDPPLAMAFLDRLVDGAIILKLRGRSYRAARARPLGEEGSEGKKDQKGPQEPEKKDREGRQGPEKKKGDEGRQGPEKR
jgi:DNA replication protein DnaC